MSEIFYDILTRPQLQLLYGLFALSLALQAIYMRLHYANSKEHHIFTHFELFVLIYMTKQVFIITDCQDTMSVIIYVHIKRLIR